MKRWTIGRCLAGLVGLGAGGAAWADTVRFDLPEIGLGIFGLQWSADYITTVGEIRNREIVDARMHLEFDTENGFGNLPDAADIAVQVQAPIVNIDRIWTVSGADLGWAGTGASVGDISSSFLNDAILDFTGFADEDLAFWFVRIVSLNDDAPQLGGAFTGSYIEIDLAPVPEPSAVLLLGLLAPMLRRR